ncbi:17637_t:CDS:1 [Gigaspora margarita]|uniref:17637_t:CDS:1 n=1 Tax=Gigaspora margarita TaxID=4874 RepID=A0ABM8VXF7_GIGMA|nr:17637_t:CDS:1 [Gigaspora margarita]
MDNRLNVEIVSNKLFALGAQIYENSKEDILHASGHACQEDLKLMLKLVNPAYLMPIHGDFRMLKNHGYLAQELGIEAQNIFVCANGEVVEAQGKNFFLSGEKIAISPHYIFDKKLVQTEELNSNLSLREKMARGGVVLIVVFWSQSEEKVLELPYIFTYGFINMEKNRNLINS